MHVKAKLLSIITVIVPGILLYDESKKISNLKKDSK